MNQLEIEYWEEVSRFVSLVADIKVIMMLVPLGKHKKHEMYKEIEYINKHVDLLKEIFETHNLVSVHNEWYEEQVKYVATLEEYMVGNEGLIQDYESLAKMSFDGECAIRGIPSKDALGD